jgi:KaiC/GvpD/RAD55 family RecA-like ATPase
MIEQRILKACLQSRKHYEEIQAYLNDNDLQDYAKHIFNEITSYYDTDKDASTIEVDFIKERVARIFPKKAEAFGIYIDALPEDVSGLNVLKELNDLRREQLGDEIASALLQKKDATSLMETYLTETDLVTPIKGDIYEAPSLASLVESVKPDNLIPIYPTKLNDAIGGGVPRQSQICIFARPDVGKTTCAINIVGGILMNGYRVLYVGNEDPSEIVILRVLTRLTEVSRHEIMGNPDKYDSIARTRGYNNFIFAGLSPGTIPEIRSLVESIKPDVLVIDQVKNLHVSKKDSSVENLEEAVEHTRNIAKEFNIVSIVVTQAGESARNKLILSLEDVYNSKTGIPGQMDLMIGIGQDSVHKDSSRVVLSMPKNKLSAPISPITCKIDYVTNTIYGPR